MSEYPDQPDFSAEVLGLDTPPSKGYINWEPLAQKIMALEPNKCVRIHRCLTTNQISAIRNYLGSKHRHRLICRTRPGQTYFWKGTAL